MRPGLIRILFDHNTPAPLRKWLTGHEVETAYERGWAELTNGDLLAAAEASRFDLMITTDKGIRYQQNHSERRVAIMVIDTNDWTRIRHWPTLVVGALASVRPGAFIDIEIPYP